MNNPTRAIQPSALEAEATGQHTLVATYHGHEYKIPGDVDDWPLQLVDESVGINKAGKLIADRGVVARALREIMGGGQWVDFVREFPEGRDLVPASTCFAMAAGFDRRDGDLAFAAIPRLLSTLRRYPDAVEATLLALGVDYGDRWRLDPEGRRRLTLRRVHVLLSHAEPSCPLGIAQNGDKRPLSGTEILLMDVYEAVARQKHPSRPMTAEALVERSSNTVDIEAEREKYRERQSKHQSRRTAALESARQWAKPEKETPA